MTYNEKNETVIYRSKMTHGKNKKKFNAYTAEEFIAAITQHIPVFLRERGKVCPGKA